MKVKKIDIRTNLNSLPNIKEGWGDVHVTVDDGRTYIVEVLTYQRFFQNEDKTITDFLTPLHLTILVEEFTKENIEAAIHYYATKDDGYWLKLYHMGSEITEETLDILTDRWFAQSQWSSEVFNDNAPGNPSQYNLMDFTLPNESKPESLENLKFKARLKATSKDKLKEELREEFKS